MNLVAKFSKAIVFSEFMPIFVLIRGIVEIRLRGFFRQS